MSITIILFGEDEVVPHDCDDIDSPTTGMPGRATAGELASALIKEREALQYNPPVYESEDHSNIHILRPFDDKEK